MTELLPVDLSNAGDYDSSISRETQPYDSFIRLLHERGLVSDQLVQSGDLKIFGIFHPDEESSVSVSALEHILVGDVLRHGGLHHARTAIELEVPDRTIASGFHVRRDDSREVIVDSDGHWMPLDKKNKDQRVRENGVYVLRYGIMFRKKLEGQSKHEESEDLSAKPYYAKFYIKNASSMFPDEWTTEEVIQSIIDIYKKYKEAEANRNSNFDDIKTDVIEHNPFVKLANPDIVDDRRLVYGIVRGVIIRLVLGEDLNKDKILSAYPIDKISKPKPINMFTAIKTTTIAVIDNEN